MDFHGMFGPADGEVSFNWKQLYDSSKIHVDRLSYYTYTQYYIQVSLTLALALAVGQSTGKPAVRLHLDSTLVHEDDVFEGFVRVGMPLAPLQVLHFICFPDKLAIGASQKCPT